MDRETVHQYVRDYEYRGDEGDYRPTEGERALIEDAINGYISAATTRDEVEWRWKHLIAGGEDAPGSAVLLSFEEAERVIKEDRERAETAELALAEQRRTVQRQAEMMEAMKAERDAMRAVVEAIPGLKDAWADGDIIPKDGGEGGPAGQCVLAVLRAYDAFSTLQKGKDDE